MAIIKSYSPLQNLSNYGTFINDTNPNSDYFRITEFNETFTGGKNGFLIEGSEYLKETTEIKIEILDVEGNPVYYEPGNGVPEYYEGIAKLISVHVYEDTPIGIGKITILGELKTYEDANGVIRDIPVEWSGAYNVKWERNFQINKNITNETRVRFYKRPIISIDEIVKPIYNVTTPFVTQSGSVEGISEIPIAGTNLSRWTAGTLYKLKRVSGDSWISSIDENTIELPNLGYTATVKEVLSSDEILVDIPYTINNVVSNFTQSAWTSSFEYLDGQTFSESALTGSFAKINISNLKTFVGDVARVKVFRKSRNDVGDYVLVQESKLESTELLRDLTAAGQTDISYGNFTQTNLDTYWTGSANLLPSINLDKLYASVKPANGQIGVQTLYTTQSVSVAKDVEYTLTFKTLYSGSVDNGKSLRAYLSSSTYTQEFLTLSGSAIYQTKQDISQNIIAIPTSSLADAKLVFEFNGSGWHVSNVSLKNAQETSFSPDEFTIVQDVAKNVASETFDFRFEFYDINNNYIPVDVFSSKTFTGGNNFISSAKLLTFDSDRNSFRFATGSIGNPTFQTIGFTVSRQNLVGPVEFGRSVFDLTGSYIDPTIYTSVGAVYPGEPTNPSDNGFIAHIDEFTGSLQNIVVGSITYTASCDGLHQHETVYRLEDGDNAPGLFASSTANQFIYKATDLSLNPSNQVITFDIRRKNLGISGATITINSGSDFGTASALLPLFDDPTTGVATYYLSGSTFNYTSGSATYFFSASDGYDVDYHDAVKITPIKILDGLSVNLSNENASLPAKSTGFVETGSFALTSGSVNVKVGSETITHSNNLTSNNRFDVISAIATNVQTGSLTYSTNDYYITRLDADSGSLNLTIRYQDGAGDTTDVTKLVTYTKAKKAAPVVVASFSSDAQAITKTNTGTYGTPTTFTISVNEGGSNYSYSTGGGVNTYQISIGSGQGTGTTTIQPTTPTTDAGTTVNITITYVNSEGTVGTITKTHRVSVTIDGNNGTNGTNGTNGDPGPAGGDGPGVVFRGPWSSTTTYNSVSQDPTRKDVVLYSGTYYATKANATANLNKVPNTQTSFWQSLGTDSFFVAAEMIISKESYVQNTINVGTNGSGNANITIAGGTTSPYISIGQATKGYNNIGAWLGSDGTNGKLSLKSSTNSLLWDGSSLTINGAGTFTGALSGGTISIGSGDNIFKADSNGIYLGNATFASAPFRVTPAGVLTSTSGAIGGWTLGASTLTGGNATLASSGNITLGTSNDIVRLSADDGTYRIWVGNSSAGSAPFRVTKAGAVFANNFTLTGGSLQISDKFSVDTSGNLLAIGGDFRGTITATSGVIGGFTIGAGTIYSTNLVLNSAEPSIRLKDAVTSAARVILSNDDSLTQPSSTTPPLAVTSVTTSGVQSNSTGPTQTNYIGAALSSQSSGQTAIMSSGAWNASIGQTATLTYRLTPQSGYWHFSGNCSTSNVNINGMSVNGNQSITLHTPSGDIKNQHYFSNANNDGNTLNVGGNSEGSFTFVITAGVYYVSLGTSIANGSAQGSTLNTPYSMTQYISSRTPNVDSFAISISDEFTEINAAGLQVVSAANKKVIIPRDNNAAYQLQVTGSIVATGNIVAFSSSDTRLKDNLFLIQNPIDKLNKLNGYEFDWNGNQEHFVGHDIGVAAQEVQEIYPEIVTTMNNGYLGVKYEKLVPLLIESVKELKREIDELKKDK